MSKKMKRCIAGVLLALLLFNSVIIQCRQVKAAPVAIPLGAVAWDVVGTIIAVLAGYEISEIVTDDESKYCKPSAWVADDELTQEKIDFVLEHQPVGHYRMTDEKSQELWRNINKEEFDELRNLYNSNRNPDFYTGDGNNLAINLNFFKDIFKYFRDKIKTQKVVGVGEVIFSGYNGSVGESIKFHKPNELRYGVYIENRNGYYSANAKYYESDSGDIEYCQRTYWISGFSSVNVTKVYFINAPYFEHETDLDNYLITGILDNKFTNTLYQDADYIPENFKPDTKTVLPNEISELDELRAWITGLITPTMPSTQVIKIIGGEEIPATGIYDLDEDEDEDNYFGILGNIFNILKNILDFILEIPQTILNGIKEFFTIDWNRIGNEIGPMKVSLANKFSGITMITERFQNLSVAEEIVYPVIKMDMPGFLKNKDSPDQIVIFDFNPFKTQIKYVRTILTAILWVIFGLNVIHIIRVRLTID